MELNKETMMQLNRRNPKHVNIYKELLTYAATNGTQGNQVEDYLDEEKSNKIYFDHLCLILTAAILFGIYFAYVINFPLITPMIKPENLLLILILFCAGIAFKMARFSDQVLLYRSINDIIRCCSPDTIRKAYIQMIKYENRKK